jgi:predicted transcriptional regulator
VTVYVQGARGVADSLGLSQAYVSMAITMGRLDKLTRTSAERTTVVEEVLVG